MESEKYKDVTGRKDKIDRFDFNFEVSFPGMHIEDRRRPGRSSLATQNARGHRSAPVPYGDLRGTHVHFAFWQTALKVARK